MPNRAMILILMCVFPGLCLAATVNLKDGRFVQGDIVKQDGKNLQINVDGVTMTYYADEIKDIDGKPFEADAADPVDTTAAAVPAPVSAQPPAARSDGGVTGMDPEKKTLILKFIDVFGTRQALNNNFETMLSQIEKTKPQEALNIRQRVKTQEIIERLLPVYDRNFTSDELRAYINFYGSPEGQKLIETIPELMKESVSISIKYMEEKFPEVKTSH